ncbi:sulfurtransferase complex subunit TusB [Photobacterium nomapromontoriensis]|uniref:sulfurtransferase complex subunit TusB n=1 Tax=Photobacterium nomapromontoriensis TaxID=2910237 RepID=UPI003D0C95E0
MLHILTGSPFQTQSFKHCSVVLEENDAVLLIQDAVIAVMAENSALDAILKQRVKIYLLAADMQARGLAFDESGHFEVVDYKGFVSLTVKHETQMKWG